MARFLHFVFAKFKCNAAFLLVVSFREHRTLSLFGKVGFVSSLLGPSGIHLDVFRKIAGACLLVSLLGGCGGSNSSDPADGGPVDGEKEIPIPPPDGASSFVLETLALSLEEDSFVSGQLLVAPATAINFVLLDEAEEHSFELDSDGRFTFTPAPDFFGEASVKYYAWDASGGSLPSSVDFTVNPVEDAPVVELVPELFIEQGRRYLIRLYASDADGDELFYEAANLPQWLRFEPETGILRGYPAQTDVGLHQNIQLSALDETGIRTSVPPFSIEVIDINERPQVNADGIPESLIAKETVTLDLSPDDPDGDQVEIQVESNSFMDTTVNGNLVTIVVKDVDRVISTELTTIARDSAGLESRETFPLTLYPITASGQGQTLLGRKQGNGIHLVILGDGFSLDELPALQDHTFDLIGMLQNDPAIEPHIAAWNIHLVSTPSDESGIDDVYGVDLKSTAFDAGYNCQGIERLVCANQTKMFEEALNQYPYLDQIVMLVNDRRYGGSGGSVAIASAFTPEIALHEMGHSFAGLADEYIDGEIKSGIPYVEGQYPNISALSDPLRVPWAHWIDDVTDYPTIAGTEGVGIFQGGFYHPTDYYRPLSASRMRFNARQFGLVNGEQWALKVYEMTNPVDYISPAQKELAIAFGDSTRFYVEPVFDLAVQQVQWWLNGEELIDNSNVVDIVLEPAVGIHTLELVVSDVSGVIRDDPDGVSTFEWSWELHVQ